MSNDMFLWVEKYRPKTVAECVLPETLKKQFQDYVDAGEIPNLILTGTAGVGKTTVARAMCEEIGCDYILINGSTESGIDTLRVKVSGFASSVSLLGGRKVIIIDEADNLTSAAQMGFRGVIEEFAGNCTFIFTCNFINRIMDAIHSRCAIITFKLSGEDKAKMAALFMKRVSNILETEKVGYDKKVIAELIMKFFPDYRRVLNELQSYGGTIDVGILAKKGHAQIDALIGHLKNKDFKSIRQWVGENSDADSTRIMRDIYDRVTEFAKPNSVPLAVVLLGKYQYQAAFVADQEINTMAFLTELLVEVEFK